MIICSEFKEKLSSTIARISRNNMTVIDTFIQKLYYDDFLERTKNRACELLGNVARISRIDIQQTVIKADIFSTMRVCQGGKSEEQLRG